MGECDDAGCAVVTGVVAVMETSKSRWEWGGGFALTHLGPLLAPALASSHSCEPESHAPHLKNGNNESLWWSSGLPRVDTDSLSAAASLGFFGSSICPGSPAFAHKLPLVVLTGSSRNHCSIPSFRAPHTLKKTFVHIASASWPPTRSLTPFSVGLGFPKLYGNCSPSQQRPPPQLSLSLLGEIGPMIPKVSRESLLFLSLFVFLIFNREHF